MTESSFYCPFAGEECYFYPESFISFNLELSTPFYEFNESVFKFDLSAFLEIDQSHITVLKSELKVIGNEQAKSLGSFTSENNNTIVFGIIEAAGDKSLENIFVGFNNLLSNKTIEQSYPIMSGTANM